MFESKSKTKGKSIEIKINCIVLKWVKENHTGVALKIKCSKIFQIFLEFGCDFGVSKKFLNYLLII